MLSCGEDDVRAADGLMILLSVIIAITNEELIRFDSLHNHVSKEHIYYEY